MKWLWRVVLGVVALVVLVFGALAIFVATFDVNQYKSVAIDWVKKEKGRTLAIDGPLKLSVFPRVELKVSGVSLSEKGRPEVFAKLDEAALALDLMPLLRRQIDVGRVQAKGLRLNYLRDARGVRNFDDLFGPPASPGPASPAPAAGGGAPAGQAASPGLAGLDIASIVVEDVKLTLRDEMAALRGELELQRLSIGRLTPGVATPVEFAARMALTQPVLKGQLSGKTQFKFDLGSPPVIELAGLNLAFSGDVATLRQTELKLEATVRAQGTSTVIEPLAIDLRLGSSPVGAQNARLKGKVELAGTQTRWNLAGQLAGSDMSTEGSLQAGEPSRVAARARLAVLDLDALRGAAPPAAAQAAPAASTDTPVDLSGAAALNGTVELAVGKLVANRIAFTEVKAALRGDGKVLSLTNFGAKVWGGAIQGSGSVTPAARRVALDAVADGIRIEQALKDVMGRDPAEGSGRVTLNVQTTGRSVNEFKSNLGGKASMLLRDGAIKGINLAKTLRQAKAALKGKADDVQKVQQSEKTDFSEISASFDIASGVARNSDLAGKSPYLRLTGAGQIDIGKGALDYTAQATVTDTSKGQDGADLAELRGVNVPVRLSGPFEAVQYEVKWSAIGASVAKEALKSKVGEQAKTQVKDKLKGFFK